jgi:RNA polymerase sigma factor (sigma-70 family)
MGRTAIADTLAAIWHIESARVVATVARLAHDLGLAEECAQDALVAALEHWPAQGIPENPAAWLTTTAKRRALDVLRHRNQAAPKHAELAVDLDTLHAIKSADLVDAVDTALDDDIGDGVLALIFTACHPLLSPEARAALTLKVVGGLSVEEIARAYLKPPATIAQRIVRAKRTLAEARIPFAAPRGAELTARLPSVLEVLYLIFNEGYAATAGEDWMRPALCEEAQRLGRVLASRLPDETEVHGLLALMEIQASRLAARVDKQGDPILLLDQDRSRWDRLLIRCGLAALTHAQRLPGPIGAYTLQAAIAACHARAALAQVAPSPVVALNQAVAIGMAYGPAAGLERVEALAGDPALKDYHLLPAVRGDLLAKLDRIDEACAEFSRAAELARNARERALLLARAAGRGGIPATNEGPE